MGVDLDVGHAVRPHRAVAGLLGHPGSGVGVGARVHVDFQLPGHHLALLADAGLDADARGMAGHGLEALANAHGQLDRPAVPHRKRRGDGIGLDVELAAVAAADIGHHHAHPVERQLEDPAQVSPQRERVLARAPHRQALAVVVGEADVGLQRVVLDPVEAENVLEDMVGLCEALLDVTPCVAEVVAHVGALEPVRRAVLGAPQLGLGDIAFMHLRSARRQGVVHVVHEGQFLVLDIDEPQGLLGHQLVRGQHRGHRVADVADLVHRHHRLVLVGGAVFVVESFELVPGQDVDDPRHGPGLAGIDLEDPRMRQGAPQDLGIRHARKLDVPGIKGRARNLLHRVEAHRRAAGH